MEEGQVRVRVTLRCFTDDMDYLMPDWDEELTPEDDPLVREAVAHADTAEETLKRILCIPKPLVYRVRHSRKRGAVWLDREAGILWLLAAETREEDSNEDAYEYFQYLHQAGRLLPTEDDYLRDRAEVIVRFNRRAPMDVEGALDAARSNSGEDQEVVIGGTLPARICVVEDEDLEELWVMVSCRDIHGDNVDRKLAQVVMVYFEEQVESGAWEIVDEWRDGRKVPHHYVAKYGLSDRRGYA